MEEIHISKQTLPRKRERLSEKDDDERLTSTIFSDFTQSLLQLGDNIYDDGKNKGANMHTYDAIKVIGHGAFGCVFEAVILETQETVAIKKVLQNRKFKNRELQIMHKMSQKNVHPFIVQLKHSFLSTSQNDKGQSDIFLNLVLEYIPETLYSIAKQHHKQKERFPLEHVRIYMYQLARALAHMHALDIAHRDIKPHNLLVDPNRFLLKVCDFGSSKILIKGEPNVAYICSRYYRAPELIFGSNDYTTTIDMWSYGCVMAELLLGTPMFPGSSGVDQLVEIIKVLGSPSKSDLRYMNPTYQEFKFPNISAHDFTNLFPAGTDNEGMSVVGDLLKYVPESRATAMETVIHPFFLPHLKVPTYRLPDERAVPDFFFELTVEEEQAAAGKKLPHEELFSIKNE